MPSFAILRRPAIAVAVLAFVMAVVGWRFNPPAPVSASAPANAFSADRAIETMRSVVGDVPHPTGSKANDELRARLVGRLRGLGLEPTEQHATGCNRFAICADVVNVVAELPGASSDAILLATHYDSVPAAPGAADDGAGVAALLETARALLNQGDRPRTVLLLFSDGEELGMLGARGFVAEHPAMARVTAVINVEARGVGGPSMMFETSGPSAPLMKHLRALPRPVTSSLMDAVYERMPNDTDFSTFRDAGVPGFNFAFIREFGRYHTPQDDLDHLDRGSLQHHGDNILALTRSLLAEPIEGGEGDAVWFELLGWALFAWPRTWAVALAVIAAALVLAAVARALSAETGFFPRYMRAVGSVLATLLLTLALSYGVVRLLHARTTSVVPDHSHGGWAAAAVALGSLTLGAILMRVTTRGCGPTAAQAAGWSLWALFGALTSTELPAASHIFVVPTLLAGLAALVVLRRPADDPARVHVMLLPQAVAVVLWGEALLGLVDTFNLVGAFAGGPVIGLWMAASASHWVPPDDAERSPVLRRAAAAMAVASVGVVLMAYVQPVDDASHPQRMSIGYYQAEKTAQWWVDASFGEVPEPVREAGDLGDAGASPHPFVAFVKAATGATESVGLAPPQLEVISVEGHRWHLRLRSARGAPVLALMIPPGPKVDHVSVDGHSLRPYVLSDSPLFPSFRSIATATASSDGIEVDVDLGAGPPPALMVMDATYDLPASADALVSARGDTGFGSQNGDVSMVVQRVSLERPEAE